MIVKAGYNIDQKSMERDAREQLGHTKKSLKFAQSAIDELRQTASRRKALAAEHFPIGSVVRNGRQSGTAESINERTGLLNIRLKRGGRTTWCPIMLIESQSPASS